jgi:hypothetical protein
MSSPYLIKGLFDTLTKAHQLPSLLPLNLVELLRKSALTTQVSLHHWSSSTKGATCYFTFVPDHRRDNREATMFLSAVKGSRDEKIEECAAR